MSDELEKIINHIVSMRLDAEQRIEVSKDNVEYFEGVRNACKSMELYIRRHLMTVKERSNV